jgi:hypothetical protein
LRRTAGECGVGIMTIIVNFGRMRISSAGTIK